jgi:hypothetical protein
LRYVHHAHQRRDNNPSESAKDNCRTSPTLQVRQRKSLAGAPSGASNAQVIQVESDRIFADGFD